MPCLTSVHPCVYTRMKQGLLDEMVPAYHPNTRNTGGRIATSMRPAYRVLTRGQTKIR